MRKSHNQWTNHEVELLRTHWPTKMPLAELLAMLPRHTENSVTGYANRVLKLKRPVVRKKPTWTAVKALLEERFHSAAEIQTKMRISRARVHELLQENPGEWYIADYKWPETFGSVIPLYGLGNLPDAIKPPGAQRQRSVKRVNPFLAAAGLVQAPQAAQTGRIYRQSMEVESEAVA
ncbi:hypothetical protein VSR82_07630 [Burkholderia sp. JPY481]